MLFKSNWITQLLVFLCGSKMVVVVDSVYLAETSTLSSNTTIPSVKPSIRPIASITRAPTHATDTSAPNIPASEYAALKDIYCATNGPFWTWENVTTYQPLNLTHYFSNITGQLPPRPTLPGLIPITNITQFLSNSSVHSHWNFTGNQQHNPCQEQWQGVQCLCYVLPPGVSYCNVFVLDLPSYNMSGRLSDSIGNLTLLSVLRMNNNFLSGPLPEGLTQLQVLSTIELHHNDLEGSIPSNIGDLTGLLVLQLFDNFLTGSIPSSITDMQQLLSLSLSINSLTGQLPANMNRLSELESLMLYNNSLSGPIPAELCEMESLKYLFLSHNGFNSTIPAQFGNLSSLHFALLDFNELTGTLPVSIGNMSHLHGLYLAENHLTGSLPSSMVGMTSLYVLLLTLNHFTGWIPAEFDQMPALEFVYLDSNHFSGPMPTFLAAAQELRVIFLARNLLTGTIPKECTVGASRLNEFAVLYNALTGNVPTFAGDGDLAYVDCYANQLSGTFPSSMGNLSFLNFIDVGNNQLTGTVPRGLGKLNRLSYLYVNDNALSGVVPKELGDILQMAELWMYNNAFSGTIHPNLGSLHNLLELYLFGNRITGSIPSTFQNLGTLQLLFLYDNQLTGSMDGVFNATTQRNLTNVDVSNNQLTGSIPDEVFSIPSLSSFAASTNCLRGSISYRVCDAHSLTALALDGLSTATSCQNILLPMFKGRGGTQAYALRNYFDGGIPKCLFSMPLLQSLHLSGNGIQSSINPDIVISNSLVDLSLSHNILTGHIPKQIQERPWSTLDLSFNKLSGTLSTGFFSPAPNSSLSLQVNRLSGLIPESLLDAQDITLLDGNLFQCGITRTELPKHDSKTPTYQCGSDAFNRSVYFWMAIAFVGAVCVALLLLAQRHKISAESSKFVLWMRECSDDIRSWKAVFTETVSPTSDQTANIFDFGLFVSSLRRICIQLTAFMVVVLLPIYLALTNYLNTYTYEYAWTASAAYLSGTTPAITLLVAFSVLIALTIFIFDRYVFSTPTRVQSVRLESIEAAQGHNQESMFSSQSIGQFACLGFVAVLNLAVIIPIDMVYVYIVLNYNIAAVAATQFSLALFKIFWNDAVRAMMDFARRLYFNKPFDAPHLLPSAGKKRELRDTLFLVYVVLVNNIAAPCIAIASISSDCFYNVIEAPPAVDSSYFYTSCFQDYVSTRRGYTCVRYGTAYQDITYSPPYLYSYQCSSVFATNYATLYVYMFILVGFLLPLAKIFLVLVRDRCGADSSVRGLIERILPHSLRSLDQKVTPTTNLVFFDRQRFVVRSNSNIAILLTFGAMCPPMSLVICVSALSCILFDQLSIGRLLTEAKACELLVYRRLVDFELRDVGEFFEHSVWIVVPFASLFYAYFVFDTLGDSVGATRASWAPIVMMCVPMVTYAVVRLKACRRAWEMSGDLGEVLTSRFSTVSHYLRDSVSVSGQQSESQQTSTNSISLSRQSIFGANSGGEAHSVQPRDNRAVSNTGTELVSFPSPMHGPDTDTV